VDGASVADVTPLLRGHIATDPPPAIGEEIDTLIDVNGVVIEHIQSGTVTGPVDYLQDHHEWVLVVQGHTLLEVDDTTVDLGDGDWVVLPAGVAHRVVSVEPGTRWLAVRIPGVLPT
jgi:cupin 2 domain-containing protein